MHVIQLHQTLIMYTTLENYSMVIQIINMEGIISTLLDIAN
jgi:hypothetical protein